MRLKEVLEKIDGCCPFALQEDWDNSGLQLGDPAAQIRKILMAFDFTEAVLGEAVEKRVDLVITHHPFFFQGVKSIDLQAAKGRMIGTLIKNKIAIVSCHTCLDKVDDGVSAVLGQKLGLTQLNFFLPEVSGVGFGMVGSLKVATTFGAFAETVKKSLGLSALRSVGEEVATVKKVVVMGGAGAEFMAAAKAQGADVYVSGDFKYHDAQAAKEMGLNLIDAGHFGTEAAVMEPFMKKLAAAMESMEFLLSAEMKDFWSYR